MTNRLTMMTVMLTMTKITLMISRGQNDEAAERITEKHFRPNPLLI